MFRVFITTVNRDNATLGQQSVYRFNRLIDAIHHVNNSVGSGRIVTLADTRRRGKILMVR